jgi:hypothetical protein
MANKYFAQLDENNIVIRTGLVDEGSAASEAKGEAFLRTLYKEPNAIWKQYDKYTVNNTQSKGQTPFRGNSAMIGGEWDEANQVFWHVAPFPSWVKEMSNYSWQAPVAYPSANQTAGYSIFWNEADQRWDAVKFSDESTWSWDPDTGTWIAR